MKRTSFNRGSGRVPSRHQCKGHPSTTSWVIRMMKNLQFSQGGSQAPGPTLRPVWWAVFGRGSKGRETDHLQVTKGSESSLTVIGTLRGDCGSRLVVEETHHETGEGTICGTEGPSEVRPTTYSPFLYFLLQPTHRPDNPIRLPWVRDVRGVSGVVG